MAISKLKYVNLSELKEQILKDFRNITPQKKDAIFTILTTVQAIKPKLRLKDITLKSDGIQFFQLILTYNGRNINKILHLKELSNLQAILLTILN